MPPDFVEEVINNQDSEYTRNRLLVKIVILGNMDALNFVIYI